ncbi:PREDICTED: F-box protein PP2-A15-like isoform X2 [Camelina sativa]|uniref:F-box protein PP2-A15-like isoform X2 n=1 Tax=Camelina sativa TaxID=90675 RepID=A0ABM0YSF2_CAMSA|nr:PREDICTED: F-box protein PP2-A15-like isoform X2 [Camelina sativa]
MGSSFSNLNGDSNGLATGPSLGDIPESCVACVILHLTPPEICNLARLNRAFRGAASSDSVWEKKLPSNYHDLLVLLPPERYQSLSKKDIFALLSRPIPFDDGNKEVWIDRLTGRVCMAISARGMAITGIEDRRYWNWIATDESRFHVVAYLQQIWWFEVDGVVRFNLPPGVYCLSFKIHLGRFSKRLGRRVCHFEHTHGWELKPVRFSLSTSDGQEASCEYYLADKEIDEIGGEHRGYWREYKVGEFVVGCSETSTEVRWSMKQIDCTHSKGGICVDSVFIIPIEVKRRKKRKAAVK